MAERTRQYQDIIAELYPNAPKGKDGHSMATQNITFQVTDACNLACSYCYQHNKSTHVMSMDVAKRFIDMILEDNDDTAEYIDSKNSIAVIMEFIGGEPLLQIDLIDDIITYFVEQMILLDHPWQYHYMISICSNGVLYFDPKWQAFMKKHWNHLSFNISIDGNKQLHDACRVFPDGSGSYDKAIAGVRHFVDVLGGQMGSKMTLAPQNIQYTCDAVKGLIASGYKEINLNCVFEKGWTEEHATILYYQLKELADYIIDNNLDVYISMFEQSMFHPKDREDRQNWCWGAGTRILTSAGLVPIEEITIGTMVMTEDGSYHPVIQTMHHMADNCVKIFDKFVCTDDHKLYVYNEYFSGTKPIKDILETDNIKTYSEHTGFGHLSGHWMEASYVEPQEVYNITVDTNHSYIAEGLVSANCGGNGQMISVDWKGDIYPCIRYMESSLGNDVPPLIIGNVYDGILTCSEHKECARCLKAVDRITQSTEECIDCAIAEGCAWCFPAGTKIRLPYNYKNIEDIEIGDIVLDNNGLPQKVENIISRKAKKDELIYIHAAGVKDLLTTKEHPFLALPVEKKHNNYPIYAKEPKWVKACDLKTTDRIALFMPKIGNEDFDLTKAYLIGRYVGDGYKTGSNRTKHPYRYYITCAFDEQDELEEKFNLLPNLKFTKSSQRTVFAYNIPITNNEDMINILEDCGRDSLTKRVPEAVYGWKKECIEAFLKGYFDADGDFDTAKQIQRYSTSSSDLAYGIAELIRMVYHKNVNFTYIILKPKTIIEGREVNQHPYYQGRFLVREEKRHHYQYDEEKNIMWVNISQPSSIIPEEEEVYNLTVANTNTYIANDVLVHNCQAFNYEDSGGNVNHRATYICVMHQARALGNAYYWNKLFRKNNEMKRMKIWLEDEKALKIIPQEELDMLKELEWPVGADS